MQRDTVDTLAALNGLHAADRVGTSELAARIASYELAFQLQSSAPELLDLSGEDDRTLQAYGLYDKHTDHPMAGGRQHSPRRNRMPWRPACAIWRPRWVPSPPASRA